MAARFWVGGAGNWDASDTTHWAATSGGAGGQSVPGAADTVTLDANSGGGAVTVTAPVSVTSITGGAHTGTLDTNGQSITVATFSYTGTGTRTLTLGSSAIACTGTGNAWATDTVTNLTITANTAVVTLSGASSAFRSGTMNFNGMSVVMSGSGAQSFSLASTLTFANITLTGSAAKTDSNTLAGSLVATGTFTASGNSLINRLFISSTAVGTARTITAATTSLTNVDFQDITASGAAAWTGTSLGDSLGNTGITFDAPTTQTRSGADGNYDNAAQWTSRVPLPQDNVVINGTASGSIAVNMPRLGKDIDFTGFAGTVTLSTAIGNRNEMYGSITLSSGMTWAAGISLGLMGRGSHTITSNGNTFNFSSNRSLTIGATSVGTYTLQDALIFVTGAGSGDITINSTLVTSNFNITATFGTGTLSIPSTGTFTAGTSTILLLCTVASATTLFSANGSATINASSSTIVFGSATTQTRTFEGGGKTYGTLRYTVAGSTGQLNITGSNTFDKIEFSDTTNARTLAFTAGTTTTFTGAGIVGSGASGRRLVLSSITAATHTLSKASGTVSVDWWDITNSIAAGGAGWYAGANSTDSGGNTGWIFTAPPTDQSSNSGDSIIPRRTRFVYRSVPTIGTGSPDDTWIRYLQLVTGSSQSNVGGLEKTFLRQKGGSGETYWELWNSYLDSRGVVAGTLMDRQRAFFDSYTQT